MMLVRPSTEDDVAAIAAIYGWHVINGSASFETEAPGEAEMARRRAEVLKQGLPWFVAEDEGKVVGYAYASLYRMRFAYRFTCENSIYVDHTLTGKGVGRALLAELLDTCTAKGYRQMIAVIGDSANTASIRLHENFGFRHSGVFRSVGFKFNEWRDTVQMQRALGPGDESKP